MQQRIVTACWQPKATKAGRIYKPGWVTDLKWLHFTKYFGHVSTLHGVGDEDKLLQEFSLRLADIARQKWKSDTDSNTKLSNNLEGKSLLKPETGWPLLLTYIFLDFP